MSARAASRRAPKASPAAVEATPTRLLPALDELADPRGPFLIPLLLLLIARIVTWYLIPVSAEDAYITYRFARNFAVGNGLVYNPGTHVFGFTSIPWTLWSALGIWLVHDPVPWTRAWTVLADVSTLVLMGHMLKRHASSRAAWCFTFFFACWPYFSAVAVSGMESSVFLASIVWAAALIGARNPAAGPALALVALMRPEGVAAALVLSLWARWRDRLIAAGIVIAALAAIWAYYGTIVPQSLTAKRETYGIGGPWTGRYWWEWIVPIVFARFPATGETSALVAFVILAGPAFALGLAALWRERRTPLAAAVAGGLVVWGGYTALGVTYFWWYFLVPFVAVTAAVTVGLPRLLNGRIVLISAALFVVSFWSAAQQLYRGRAREESVKFGAVASFLTDHARRGDSVMLEPIGIIGYFCPLRVIDEVGLVSPEVARRRQQGPGWYTDIVRKERPNWLVLRNRTLRTGAAFAGQGMPFRDAADRAALLRAYEPAGFGDEKGDDAALIVLRRHN